ARALGAARVVVTAPVGAPDAVERLRADADDVVCLQAPDAFSAVGQWYADFRPTTDEEVERLLAALRP
ncbi:MAG: phosphoribosyltransferase, partial [Frankiales bacterium]|nr:phosphoribosyltransferase [Frankiales bacterium]